jgi:hypothetical protein
VNSDEEGQGSGGSASGGTSGAGSGVVGPRGLHVSGNEIHDADGNRIVLRGVNRSGTEYECVKNDAGIFDGPATEESVRAMTTWNINAVRVPLNESCWLGINGAPARYAGENYKRAIGDYVAVLHRHGLVPILDLHWVGPGDLLADGTINLLPMPSEHSPAFWADVAAYFRDDDGIVLEPFNEPFPGSNRDTPEAWQCWRDGCEVSRFDGSLVYPAVGMQALVDAIREAGSRHVLLLGGVQFANGLSGWLEYKPYDRLDNFGAAWHVYNKNHCRDLDCWNGAPAEVARSVPVVATEVGQNDCSGETFLRPLLTFLDDNASGYLAWSWNTRAGCDPVDEDGDDTRSFFLIRDYGDPQPNGDYARVFYEHLESLR